MELALQYDKSNKLWYSVVVTILVFMELALQSNLTDSQKLEVWCHNPCFYGISFAIYNKRPL